MSYNSKYKGSEVESLLDKVDTLEIPDVSGFATKDELSGKVDKVSGKQLSTEDFTSALKTKLEGLSNYDDTELSEALSTLRGDFDKLVSGDTTTAIKSFNDIIAFLEGIQDTQDLSSIIASIQQQIAGKMDKVTLAKVATSGSYNDLTDKPTIPTSAPKLVIPNVTVADLEQVVTSGKQTLIFGDTGDLAYYLNNNYPIYIKYDADYEYPSLFQVYGFFDGDQYYLYTLVGNQQYTIEIYTDTSPCYVERSTIPYSLKKVNGESIIGEGDITIVGGGGDEPYITTCTVGDLRNLAYGIVDRMQFEPRELASALSENKRVLMPYDAASSHGYYSVVGRSQGNILYLTVVSNAEAFDIQASLNYPDLYAGDITRLVIPSENQLGNAAIHQLAFDFPMVYDVFEEGQYEVNSEDYGTFFDTAEVEIIAEKIRTEGNVVVAVVDDRNGYQLLPATVWFDEQGAEFNILVYSPYSKYWYEILMNLQSGYQSIKRYKNYIEGNSSAYPQIDAGLDGDTFDIVPNTFYVFGEKTDLDITFIDAESSGNGGKACEYLFQFTSGSEGTTLVLNDDIKWASELVIEPNKIYQISILNGLGTVMSWDNSNLIAFSVLWGLSGTLHFECEKGMTWEAFVASSYNTDSALRIYNGNIWYGSYRIQDVTPTTIIENGKVYTSIYAD